MTDTVRPGTLDEINRVTIVTEKSVEVVPPLVAAVSRAKYRCHAAAFVAGRGVAL